MARQLRSRSGFHLWLFIGSVCLFGCTSSDGGPTTRPASVRPGINDPYRSDPIADHWVAKFEIESREVYAQRARIAAECGVTQGMHVADVGAGTGILTREFAGLVGPSGQVFAVDLMPSFVEHIAARVKADGMTNVTTVLCKEDSVELPDASIDLAFVCDTYHHFEYPASTLASIHRALRPGGRLVVVDFIRIPGRTPQWVLDHVRAGEEVFTAEIVAAGFDVIGAKRWMNDNYFVEFRRRETP